MAVRLTSAAVQLHERLRMFELGDPPPETPLSTVSRFSDLATSEPTFNLASPELQSTAALRWRTEPTALSPQAALHLASVLQKWADLAALIQTRIPATSLEALSRRCFDLFFEYLFPLIPLADEPSLRDALNFFITGGDVQHRDVGMDRPGPTTPSIIPQPWLTPEQRMMNASSIKAPELWLESTFTWITAILAEVAFFLPAELFPEGGLIAETFLQASRDCLASYFETDLEQPNASSVAIRYLHSNCLHAVGKQRYSWHLFGEATRLAQVMHLHDEASYEGLAPVEAELRRRAFWLVYMGDKSAALLNNRPITIHKFSFESGITSSFPSGGGSDFIIGFNANLRLWQTASDLLLEMRLIQDRNHVGGPAAIPSHMQGQAALTSDDRISLDTLYVRFATCLDDLPPHLLPDSLRPYEHGSGQATTSPASINPNQNQFVIQIANLQVSYHCLRMIVAQRLEDLGYLSPAGPGMEQASLEMLLLRKTEIARDLLRIIREAPFWALQVNGEPNVEKIRLVGASLLAIIHQNETSALAARARKDFMVLLDVLTRLDSKASDALREGFSWAV